MEGRSVMLLHPWKFSGQKYAQTSRGVKSYATVWFSAIEDEFSVRYGDSNNNYIVVTSFHWSVTQLSSHFVWKVARYFLPTVYLCFSCLWNLHNSRWTIHRQDIYQRKLKSSPESVETVLQINSRIQMSRNLRLCWKTPNTEGSAQNHPGFKLNSERLYIFRLHRPKILEK